jgi:thiol-disulfide isomerase/thioredoxin
LTFEEILSNQKGKIVLVDFWASWCSPCRKEMPFLKDLKSKFNENELKVIEISIDKDYSAWVRASKLESLSKEEDNYIIANWKKSSLYKNYKIKTIPRYLLFDKNGKIIDDDAPRPSENELIKLIKASI